ncbi:hypothetical protein B0H14DRAFT_3856628, partial [Mycena olivaceomarginata]
MSLKLTTPCLFSSALRNHPTYVQLLFSFYFWGEVCLRNRPAQYKSISVRGREVRHGFSTRTSLHFRWKIVILARKSFKFTKRLLSGCLICLYYKRLLKTPPESRQPACAFSNSSSLNHSHTYIVPDCILVWVLSNVLFLGVSGLAHASFSRSCFLSLFLR